MDWSKLTSRKLWVSIAGFAGMLAMYFGVDASEAERIVALIMAGATVIGYVIGEGLVDRASAGAPTTVLKSGPTEIEGGAEAGE